MAGLDARWNDFLYHPENKQLASLVTTPKKVTANRHQSDSNLLTPACPDAILESVEAIARLMPNDLNRRCPEAVAPHRGVIATYQRLATRLRVAGLSADV